MILTHKQEVLEHIGETSSTIYDKAYQQGRADAIDECLQRVKNRLLTYSVGDDVIIDFNLLEDELLEIMEELKEKNDKTKPNP